MWLLYPYGRQSGWAQALAATGEWSNKRKISLSFHLCLSLSVTLPFKQINTSLKINKVKKEVFQVAIPHILKPQPNAGSTWTHWAVYIAADPQSCLQTRQPDSHPPILVLSLDTGVDNPSMQRHISMASVSLLFFLSSSLSQSQCLTPPPPTRHPEQTSNPACSPGWQDSRNCWHFTGRRCRGVVLQQLSLSAQDTRISCVCRNGCF